MRTLLLNKLSKLGASYWFLPSVLTVLSAILASLTLWVDSADKLPELVEALRGFYPGDAEGARTLLGTVAGSMVGIAGVAFSVTIVSLSLASTQFGPRLLRNFMRDRANQTVLGVFTGTFLFCLLILRTIRGADDKLDAFVPGFSISVSVVLGMVSIGFFIYFIHHVSNSIRAETVVALVGDDFSIAANSYETALFAGSRYEEDPDLPKDLESKLSAGGTALIGEKSGYIQAVNYQTLFDQASKRDWLIRLHQRAGDFAFAGSALAEVWGDSLNAQDLPILLPSFLIGDHQTEEQDIEYAIRQLVDVALRALSPGIHDPHTANNCIDWLTDGLIRVLEKGLPNKYLFDEKKRLRILVDCSDVEGLFDAAFNQIRQSMGPHVSVAIKLIESFTTLAKRIDDAPSKEPLLSHGRRVRDAILAVANDEKDRKDVQGRFQTLASLIEVGG